MSEFLHEFASEHGNIYTAAFIIFWTLVLIYGRKPGLRWLDSEIGKITSELNTARELRAEAEAALAEVKVKQAQAEKEAREIVDMARNQATAMRKQADAELAATLERQQQLAADRIKIAEIKAVDAIRSEAVKLGMELARRVLTDDLTQNEASTLIERGITDISALEVKAR